VHKAHRASLILSATAPAVAVLGTTPLGQAAGDRLAKAIPPFSKTAGYAKFAGDSTKLNGRRSSLKGAPGSIPVVGSNGKLPASIGAVGLQGPARPKGDKGLKGDKGDKGPKGSAGPTGAAGPAGISGYQLVTGGTENDSVLFHTKTVYCPTGKKPLGGGGFVNGVNGGGPWLVANGPTPDGNGWSVTGTRSAGSVGAVAYVICAFVS